MKHKRAKVVKMQNVWTDKYGAIYTPNRKRLLKGPDCKQYEILEGTEEIDTRAFAQNESIEYVAMPNTVNYTGLGVFWGCSSLKSCIISESITDLNGGMFIACESLQYVQLPKNLRSIGGAVFHHCTSLEFLEIPESVTYIKTPILAGSKCSIKYSGKEYKVVDRALYGIFDRSVYGEEANRLMHCPTDVKEFVVPKETKVLMDHCFHGCNDLHTITIPHLVGIGSSVFSFCDSLKRINCLRQTKMIIIQHDPTLENLLFEME